MKTTSLSLPTLVVNVLVPVIVLALAATLISAVVDSDSNNLAELCKYTAVGLFIFSVVSPKTGIYAFIFVCAFLDLVKRMMIIWGTLSFMDIANVLAISPAILAGLVVSVIVGRALRKFVFTKIDFMLIAISLVITAGSAVLAKRAGLSTLETLKQIANSGFYTALIPLMVVICPQENDIRKLLRHVTLVFIPVALYGLWQSGFGLNDFEVAYMKSGYTITVAGLDDVTPRPFSTLNSVTALGGVTGIMSILSLIPLFARRNEDRTSRYGPIFLFLLYVAACVCSLTRAANTIWLMGLMAMLCFRSLKSTIIFYVAMLVSFVTLILSASFILDNIAVWDPSQYVSSDFGEQALRLQTYADRLKGFINLTASTDMYSWFGLPESAKSTGTTFNHDGFSTFLVNFGVVPLLTVLLAMGVGLYYTHRAILRMPANGTRNLAVVLLGLFLSTLATDVLFGYFRDTFPINAFLWMITGCLATLLFNNPELEEVNVESAEEARRRYLRLGGRIPELRAKVRV